MAVYVIKNKTYGRALVGTTIYYRGYGNKRPKFLKDKGQGFAGGKHLLETLGKKFKRYSLVLTPKTDTITTAGGLATIQISERTLNRINAIVRDRTRDVRLDAASQILAVTFPTEFTSLQRVETYRKGMFVGLLVTALDARAVSVDDQKAITAFAAKIATDPKSLGFDEKEAVKRKHTVQLLHLDKLITEFEDRLSRNLSENDWQSYFAEKILYFQDSYINKLNKPNIAVVTTQFPDFGVITADDYLDLIEIKLPKTTLLSHDKSHNTFFWTADVAKAIAQVESYIDSVASKRAEMILQIEKLTQIRLRIVKPRGIVIAGSTAEFTTTPPKRDFFRLLNEGLKNVEIVPYDELSRRLRNTVLSIRNLEGVSQPKLKRRTG
jgi:hypothetical protein